MQLNRLLEHITYESAQGNLRLPVRDICYHSKGAGANFLFVCIRGQKSDGHDYVFAAIQKGVSAVVVEKASVIYKGTEQFLCTKSGCFCFEEIIHKYGVAVIVMKDGRKALAELSAAFFDYPARKLKMIGITGTKGKTTTAFLTAGILREAGFRPGMIGTVWIDNGKEKITAKHTTPESYELQRSLADMVGNGCDCCVMEVSSQGIKMNRTDGIYFDIGVFLNIEPDHIGTGEHASFIEYLYCKSRLLQQCRIGIVNQDDPNAHKILWGHTCLVETFSGKADISETAETVAEHVEFYMEDGKLYSRFQVKRGREHFTLQMQLPGMFNVYNALAAVSIVSHFGVERRQIERALRRQVIPGRCENVGISGEYVFLIDYAHNEMSLRNLLTTLRQFQPERLIVIFGCGGNRSKFRRNRMGETAGRLADLSILTSDNPRWENPLDILDDIEEGIRETKGAYLRIADRKEAVEFAVKEAKRGDIIVLAGKGHEGYQEINGIKYPMSEYELVESAVRKQRKIGR